MGKKQSDNGTPEPAPAPQAPVGFEQVATGHEGWLNVALHHEQGRRILGRLVGYEARPDGDGCQFLIKLEEPGIGKREEEPYEIPAGSVAALNETSQLHRSLAPFVHASKNGKPHHPAVCIIVGALLPLRSGRGTYRDFQVFTEPGVRAGAPPAMVATPAEPPAF